MKIRAVLLDMDGTFLGRSQVAISLRNMRALQRALRKGVTVIPCTGRVLDMLPPQLLSQEGLRYFITCHGARAYDTLTETTLYEDLIPSEEAAQILRLLEGKKLYNEIAANKTIYFERSAIEPLPLASVPEHHLWYVRDQQYTAVDSPSDFFEKHGIGVEKMNLYDIPEPLQVPIYEAVSATGFIEHTRPGAGPNLEFSHKGLDKLKAVRAVLEKIGISLEETMAIGDSSSDLSILRAAGLGVAMGNAPAPIQKEADWITSLNTQDGVALAFEKYID